VDWAILIFALCCLTAGVCAVLAVRNSLGNRALDDNWQRAQRQAATKEARRMERRRSRIWFRIENLHAEFTEKSSLAERPVGTPTVHSDPPAVEIREQTDSRSDNFSPAQLKDAFEMFLGENRRST